MTKQIHQYIRKGHKLVGVLVGTKLEDGTVRITASKANESHGDRFDKSIGLEIARNRAKKSETVIAHSMLPAMIAFNDRCSRYFKVNPTDIDCPVSTGIGHSELLENLNNLMGNLDVICQPRG
jgi:hypothetical protein